MSIVWKIGGRCRGARAVSCFSPNSMLDDAAFHQYWPPTSAVVVGSPYPCEPSVPCDPFSAFPPRPSLLAVAAQPAAAGLDEALKALQAGDVATTEKELQVLAKERDPRAQFLLGLYVYGNPESKLYDVNKATPLLLDAAERGYLPAMMPIAGAYAEAKGVPKSAFEAYKWLAVAERLARPGAASGVRATGTRPPAGRTREGQGCCSGLHLQDQMIARRVVPLAALLAAGTAAHAQSNEAIRCLAGPAPGGDGLSCRRHGRRRIVAARTGACRRRRRGMAGRHPPGTRRPARGPAADPAIRRRRLG